MKKKIFLHIGSAKTGTTSLQHFLFQNKQPLLEQKFLYPGVKHSENLIAHHNLPNALDTRSGSKNKYSAEVEINHIIEQIQNSPASKIVISSEGFLNLRKLAIQKLKDLLVEFDIQIIAYIRRTDDFMVSSYNQKIKNLKQNNTITPEKHFEDFLKGFSFYDRAKNWVDAFGKERFTLIPYEYGDTVTSFCETIGLDMSRPNLKFDHTHKNERVSNRSIKLLRLLKTLTPDYKTRCEFLSLCNKTLDLEKPDIQIFSIEQRKAVLEKFQKSNEELFTLFGINPYLYHPMHLEDETD